MEWTYSYVTCPICNHRFFVPTAFYEWKEGKEMTCDKCKTTFEYINYDSYEEEIDIKRKV